MVKIDRKGKRNRKKLDPKKRESDEFIINRILQTNGVLLIEPPAPECMVREGRCQQDANLLQSSYPPLTLAYLASFVRRLRVDNKKEPLKEIKIIDCPVKKVNHDYLIQITEKIKPGVIFCTTSSQTFDDDLRTLDEVISSRKDAMTGEQPIALVFGVHAKFAALNGEDHSDRGIYLMEKTPWDFILDVLYGPKHKGHVGDDNNDKFDLDRIPFPAWELVDLYDYQLPLVSRPFLPVMTSVGCKGKCNFCVTPFFSGDKIRKRSVGSIVGELNDLKKMGINDVLMLADTFTSDKNWTERLCEAIIKKRLNMRFMCNSRIDTIDKNLITLMKKAGFWLVSFGIESSDTNILKRCGKNINLDIVRKTIQDTADSGILTIGHFIFGLEGDDMKTAKKTSYFARSLPLDFAFFYLAEPLPGSPIHEKIEAVRFKEDKHESSYPKRVSAYASEFTGLRKNATMRFYAKRPIRRTARILKILGIRGTYSIPIGAFGFLKGLFNEK